MSQGRPPKGESYFAHSSCFKRQIGSVFAARRGFPSVRFFELRGYKRGFAVIAWTWPGNHSPFGCQRPSLSFWGGNRSPSRCGWNVIYRMIYVCNWNLNIIYTRRWLVAPKVASSYPRLSMKSTESYWKPDKRKLLNLGYKKAGLGTPSTALDGEMVETAGIELAIQAIDRS